MSGSRGTRTHNGVIRTCFQDRLLIRPDDFRKVPGVGIEPTPSWFRARRHYQQQLPRNRSAQATHAAGRGSRSVRGAGLEPASPLFKARQPAVSRSPRVPCGNRTRLARLEVWHLCRSAQGTSCGGRNRTCVGAVNSRLSVPARNPPQYSVGAAGVEPAFSCSRSTRTFRLSHTPINERPAGIEPALPPWQGSRLPLHHGRFQSQPNCQRAEHRAGLEPASSHYGCGVLAARRPVPVFTNSQCQ